MLLSKEELKLQKKGIENLTQKELNQWVEICRRNENNSKFNKGRMSWAESRKKAEILLK